MSIYRINRVGDDIHGKTFSTKRLEPKQTRTEPKNYERMRKAAPANAPLSRTLEWAKRLPPDVRPTVLLRDYARIANLIALAWDDIAFNSYMESLLTDQRGNRRGFPANVLNELSVLAEMRYQIILKEDPSGRPSPPR